MAKATIRPAAMLLGALVRLGFAPFAIDAAPRTRRRPQGPAARSPSPSPRAATAGRGAGPDPAGARVYGSGPRMPLALGPRAGRRARTTRPRAPGAPTPPTAPARPAGVR